MKKPAAAPLQFASLSEAHRALGLPPPLHPLISLLHGTHPPAGNSSVQKTHVLSLYKIAYRPRRSSPLPYGQRYYDFEEGCLLFAAPNQLIGGTEEASAGACAQFTLLLQPDFLTGYSLAKRIRDYGFSPTRPARPCTCRSRKRTCCWRCSARWKPSWPAAWMSLASR